MRPSRLTPSPRAAAGKPARAAGYRCRAPGGRPGAAGYRYGAAGSRYGAARCRYGAARCRCRATAGGRGRVPARGVRAASPGRCPAARSGPARTAPPDRGRQPGLRDHRRRGRPGRAGQAAQPDRRLPVAPGAPVRRAAAGGPGRVHRRGQVDAGQQHRRRPGQQHWHPSPDDQQPGARLPPGRRGLVRGERVPAHRAPGPPGRAGPVRPGWAAGAGGQRGHAQGGRPAGHPGHRLGGAGAPGIRPPVPGRLGPVAVHDHVEPVRRRGRVGTAGVRQGTRRGAGHRAVPGAAVRQRRADQALRRHAAGQRAGRQPAFRDPRDGDHGPPAACPRYPPRCASGCRRWRSKPTAGWPS